MTGNLLVITYHHVGREPPRAVIGDDSFELAGLHCDIRRFEAQMMIARKRKYNIIDLEHASKKLRDNEKLDDNSLSITFDEGYEHDMLLPLLQKYGIPATFFINTDMMEGKLPPTYKLQALIGMFGSDKIMMEAKSSLKKMLDLNPNLNGIFEKHAKEAEFYYQLERPDARTLKYAIHFILPSELKKGVIDSIFYSMFSNSDEEIMARQLFSNEGEVRNLSENGVRIGCHSASHFVLTTLNKKWYESEITAPKIKLESITGKDVSMYAYPHGYFTETEHRSKRYKRKMTDIMGFLESAGYLASFDYRPDLDTKTGKNYSNTNPHAMVRIDQASLFPGL
ncbi:MAG: polysaccharide deacetylase family protein [Candidatus Aenigmatarchaeota archaeon]